MNALLILDNDPGAIAGARGLERQLWQVYAEPEAPGDRRRYDTWLWFYFIERQGALIEQLPGGAMVSARRAHELQQVMQYGGAPASTLEDGYPRAFLAGQQLDAQRSRRRLAAC